MVEPVNDDVWYLCSACRKRISFGGTHWVCSVSTCNRDRTRLVFCSVACWDSHVATLHHREAWAVEALAPTRAETAHDRKVGDAPIRNAARDGRKTVLDRDVPPAFPR